MNFEMNEATWTPEPRNLNNESAAQTAVNCLFGIYKNTQDVNLRNECDRMINILAQVYPVTTIGDAARLLAEQRQS